jgi:hypothetical protein
MRAWPADGRVNYQFAAAARRISVLLGQAGYLSPDSRGS